MARSTAFKEPALAPIHFAIESVIHRVDAEALASGSVLSDSQVISVLTKVGGAAKGKNPKLAWGNSPRDQFLRKIYDQLIELFASSNPGIIVVAQPSDPAALPNPIWAIGVDAIVESAKIRKGSAPGGRAYLDFLSRFLEGGSPV